MLRKRSVQPRPHQLKKNSTFPPRESPDGSDSDAFFPHRRVEQEGLYPHSLTVSLPDNKVPLRSAVGHDGVLDGVSVFCR